MKIRWLVFVIAVAAAFVAARPAAAQHTDVIRGRVTGADSLPIEGVTVTVTSTSGEVSKTARTDRNGRYTVIFPNGDGDYWIRFTAIGFQARQVQLKRLADEEILIADARLASAVQSLDAVNVVAQGARAVPTRTDNTADVGGGDRVLSNTAVPPELAGNLAAMAASVPGIQLIPGMDGSADLFSALGLDPSQNNTTLNGLGSDVGQLPPDAAVNAIANSSRYDVASGGFSGGQVSLTTRPGSNWSSRGVSGDTQTEDAMLVDSVAEQQNAKYNSFRIGGSALGPIVLNQAFYNFSYSVNRRWQDVSTLLNTTSAGLAAAGVSRDSVSRLMYVLRDAGVPATVAGAPQSRVSTGGQLFGNIDLMPTRAAGHSLTLTLAASGSMADPTSSSLILTTPTRTSEMKSWNASASLRHTSYFGFGVLSVSTLGAQQNQNAVDPVLQLPMGSVRVTSQLEDGRTAVTNLTFGGDQNVSESRSSSIEAQNQLSWYSGSNRHRIRLTSGLRYQRSETDQRNNMLGSFTFNSLADLEAGRPASFSRQLTARTQSSGQTLGTIALGDAWRATANNDVQVVYGVRLDGNRFDGAPRYNPLVEQIYGLRNDFVPNRVYVSPRVGFTWIYGNAQQVSLVPGAARVPRATLQGGVGVFQNTPNVGTLASAINSTGLPGSAQSINCIGAAAPTPEWERYLFNPELIPFTCADGSSGTVFASSTPSVQLFDPAFRATNSIRGNLLWSGAIVGNRLRSSFNAEMSANRNQQSTVDANFLPAPRFVLGNEGNRPVYVNPGSIDPARGTVAITDSRLAPEFRSVNVAKSDLRSMSRQFTASVSPLQSSSLWRWGASYTYLHFREQYRGFGGGFGGGGTTIGNPLETHWSGPNSSFGQAPHVFRLTLFYNAFDLLRLNTMVSYSAGGRFTPMVDRDINGDGQQNDRAFVFDPVRTADPALAAGMQSLLNTGSYAGRECVRRQLGGFAERGSCKAPGRTLVNISGSLNPVKVWMPQRTRVSFSINNPLGGLDLLLHGQNNLRGWGQPANPDNRLLIVRGFDPATQQYKYDVNPRFGSARATQTMSTNPATITISFNIDIGYTVERQRLMQTLSTGRTRPGTKLPETSLRMTGANTVPNPMQNILAQADSLKLTRQQADSLATMNRRFTLKRDSIWVPVGRFLYGLPDEFSHGDVYDRYVEARKAAVDELIRLAPTIRNLLTSEQRRMLPPQTANLLDERFLRAVRAGTANAGGGLPIMMGRE